MRLAVCTLSAVLLSGCSWLNLPGKGGGEYGAQKGATYHGAPAMKGSDRCVIYSPVQPIPLGCDPAEVTLATGYQSGSKGGPAKYASAGYGSHANDAGYATQYHTASGPTLRKPKWRGTLSLGGDFNATGELLDYGKLGLGGSDPIAIYNPNAFEFLESNMVGTQASGQQVLTEYFVDPSITFNAPNISVSDVYSSPLELKSGLEFIVTPKNTLFANAGYTTSQGGKIGGASVVGDIQRRVTTQNWQEILDADDNPTGTYRQDGGPLIQTTEIKNYNIANFDYEFSDLKRIKLEVGGRHYFDPLVNGQSFRAVTPFVAASVGASRYNAVELKLGDQEQAYYRETFERNDGTTSFYDVLNPGNGQLVPTGTAIRLFDSQWVPNASLTTGMEWQVSPATAFAMETGVNFEGGREYANGQSGDDYVSIPVTLRGSFNF